MSTSLDSSEIVILKEKAAMGDRLRKLFETGELSDITVSLNSVNEDGNRETKTYNLHKSVLGAHSGYFKALFAKGGSFKEAKTNKVELKEHEHAIFERAIEYMYTGTFKRVDDIIVNSKVYVAADYFDMPALKDICLLRVAWNIEIKFKGPPPFILSDMERKDLINGLDMMFSLGPTARDAANELSRNLTRRAFELRRTPEFRDLLMKNGEIGFLMLQASYELSTGRVKSIGKIPTELHCDGCQVLTKSKWICSNGDCRLQSDYGMFGKKSSVEFRPCIGCRVVQPSIKCEICKTVKFPYSDKGN